MSRELVSLAGLAGAALMLALGVPSVARNLGSQLRDMLTALDRPAGEALRQAAFAWSAGALAFMAVCGLAGAGTVLLQTNFLLHGGALVPDLARLSPGRGLKRVFGGDNLVEALKAVAKLGVLAWAFWRAMLALAPVLGQSLVWTPETLIDRLGRELLHILLLVLGAQAGIALLDTGWIRWRFQQRLRMSREDLKEEAREADGDPKVKGRLRQLRQARARRRMAAAVAKATVVITNPTHYAVALAYERGTQAAPRVVAKGVDEAAARIRAAAEKMGVPLVANPPLARALLYRAPGRGGAGGAFPHGGRDHRLCLAPAQPGGLTLSSHFVLAVVRIGTYGARILNGSPAGRVGQAGGAEATWPWSAWRQPDTMRRNGGAIPPRTEGQTWKRTRRWTRH